MYAAKGSSMAESDIDRVYKRKDDEQLYVSSDRHWRVGGKEETTTDYASL